MFCSFFLRFCVEILFFVVAVPFSVYFLRLIAQIFERNNLIFFVSFVWIFLFFFLSFANACVSFDKEFMYKTKHLFHIRPHFIHFDCSKNHAHTHNTETQEKDE